MDDFTFEGDAVTDFMAVLPSAKLEANEAYQRGTILTLNVEVRVKSVRLEENRHGELVRSHVLAIENVAVTNKVTPAERLALIEAAHREAQALAPDDDEELSDQEEPRELIVETVGQQVEQAVGF